MSFITITKETRDEWMFGKALERILRGLLSHNPTAKFIKATLCVDNTVWEWTYKDEEGIEIGKD